MTITHTDGTITGNNGMALFMQSWRPAQPRAVVALAHGLGEHSGRYGNLITELNARDYAVYAIDHRGHGRSPGQRAYIDSWEDFRAGIRALIAYIHTSEPDLPVFLIGHSLGGLIALNYVLHEPGTLHGIIASAPALSSDGLSPVLALLSKLLSRIAPTFSLQSKLPLSGISRDPAAQQAYATDPLVSKVGTPRLATESFAAIAWTNAHAGDLKLPLLIIHGEADPIVPPESSARFIANAGSADKQRITYPGVVHETHNDLGWHRPVDDIANWLDSHL
ncbi:MAG: alpha/beta hydrolase [Roseiflexaceae bacterium]|nr:alpha/beta hydrolase [Roseiflexaceae bacterium]